VSPLISLRATHPSFAARGLHTRELVFSESPCLVRSLSESLLTLGIDRFIYPSRLVSYDPLLCVLHFKPSALVRRMVRSKICPPVFKIYARIRDLRPYSRFILLYLGKESHSSLSDPMTFGQDISTQIYLCFPSGLGVFSYSKESGSRQRKVASLPICTQKPRQRNDTYKKAIKRWLDL